MIFNRKMRRAAARKKGGSDTDDMRREYATDTAITKIHDTVAGVITDDAYYRTLICLLQICCNRFKDISKKEGRAETVARIYLEEMAKLKFEQSGWFGYQKYIKQHFGIDVEYYGRGGQNG